MAQDCLFCRIANGDIPVEFVYESERVVAIRDIHPVAPTHILIMPKAHISDVLSLATSDGALLGEIYAAAATLARQQGIAEDGFRIVVNTGPAAGQTVPHLHFHLLGGRTLGWPPG
ncbi:MAG TPA: histidine triad nucleotide-binding protein [Armatimonadota bacterium]|jgi:histidine triad (HIT) family protein